MEQNRVCFAYFSGLCAAFCHEEAVFVGLLTGSPERLKRQMAFIVEIDKLKHILRRNTLPGDARRENDAEHSWHMALMVALLAEYVQEPGLDITRAMKMALVHDLVEIDAGDTYAYDAQGYEDKAAREQAAAQRIFSLLPDDQAAELRGLWEEFEAVETVTARYAAAIDRIQPLLLNYLTEGEVWKQNGIVREQVLRRNAPVKRIVPELWPFVTGLIDDAVSKGYLGA